MAVGHFPRTRTALLLVDVINLFKFPGGAAFARRALRTARRIAALRDQAHRAGVPVVYVNDNFGRWRSDFKTIIAASGEPGAPGAAITDLLAPAPSDFFVLKPHLSGFHETPLHMLLLGGRVKTVVLAGFTADDCVLFTVADAHMLGYKVVVPADCVASQRDEERRHSLAKMKTLFSANTTPSTRLRLKT